MASLLPSRRMRDPAIDTVDVRCCHSARHRDRAPAQHRDGPLESVQIGAATGSDRAKARSPGLGTLSGNPDLCARAPFINPTKKEVEIHSKSNGPRGQLVVASGARKRVPANRITASGCKGLVSLDLIRF